MISCGTVASVEEVNQSGLLKHAPNKAAETRRSSPIFVNSEQEEQEMSLKIL